MTRLAGVGGYTANSFNGQTVTGNNDLFIVKFDSTGNRYWTRFLGNAGTSVNTKDISLDSNGHLYLTGIADETLDGQTFTGVTGFANNAFLVRNPQ